MTPEERSALDRHYQSLLEERRALEEAQKRTSSVNISSRSLSTLFTEVLELNRAFPGQFLKFDQHAYFSHRGQGEDYYNISGLLAYVGNSLGKLKARLHTAESTPVTQDRAFAYVEDAAIRVLIQRDYHEIQRAFIAGCSKSVLVLCGGVVEAILLDALQKDVTAALGAASRGRQSDLTRWDLVDLINVAVELKIISPSVQKLGNPVREYRNLIHPGNEIRNGLTFGAEEARIAIEVLHILDRDLS